MLLIRFLRYIFGYVTFSATGGFFERFLNLCTALKIPVYDIKSSGGVFYCKVSAENYGRLREPSRKSGVKLRIIRKKGLPFFLFRHKKRVGILLGLPIFLLFIFIMSGRIWSVNIVGNRLISDEVMRDALRQIGIYEGVRWSSIDATVAENALFSSVDGLSWTALNVDGSVLTVHVRETTNEKESAENDETPCHIVASRDAFLVNLQTLKGTACVENRTAVTKGQLLISGFYEAKDKSIRPCHAKGIATAETHESVTLKIEKKQTLKKVCDKNFRLRLCLFNINIPLGVVNPKDGDAIFTKTVHLSTYDRRLPLSVTIVKKISFEDIVITLEEKQTALLLKSMLHEKLIKFSESREIKQSVVSVSETDKAITADVKLTLHENIGEESVILTEETP